MLKTGTIEALYSNNRDSPLYTNPLAQIISLKKIEGRSDKTVRYHVTISDGKFYMKGILSSQVSKEISEIEVNTIIRMTEFVVLEKNNTCFVYVKKCEKIRKDDRIGSPKSISSERDNSLDVDTSKEKFENQENLNINKPDALKRAYPQKNENENLNVKQSGNFSKRVHLQQNDESKDENKSITPIAALNPFQTKWYIKGTVQKKTELKEMKKKDGKYFTLELVDKSGSIKIVAFSDAAQLFHNILSDGSVIEISKATVKMTNKKFNNCTSDYEIHLEKNSLVQLVDEKGIEISYKFIQISEMSQMLEKGKCDVIGVVHEVFPPVTVLSKQTQKELKKRDIFLTDTTGNIRLTLWGDNIDLELDDHPVMLISDVRVGEFNNTCTLNTTFGSSIKLDPEIEEAFTLRGWYDENKDNIKVEKIKKQDYQFLEEISSYGTVLVTLLHLREDNLFYNSCIEVNCSKKVNLTDEGYHCEKCNQTREDCNIRFLTTFHISDFTQQAWLQVFDDFCCNFFGMTAKELKKMGEENPTQLQTFLKSLLYKDYVIKVKRSEEVYNGEMKVKWRGFTVKKVDYVEECTRMMKLIGI